MKTKLVLLTFIFGACAVQKAPLQSDINAKGLNPPAGKAVVYVLRPSFFGSAVRGTINCDNSYLGSVAGFRFLYTIQEPGKHIFNGFAENSSELEVVLEPGKTYFLEQQMRFGSFYGRNKLVLLSDSEGTNKLSKCRLSVDCKAHY